MSKICKYLKYFDFFSISAPKHLHTYGITKFCLYTQVRQRYGQDKSIFAKYNMNLNVGKFNMGKLRCWLQKTKTQAKYANNNNNNNNLRLAFYHWVNIAVDPFFVWLYSRGKRPCALILDESRPTLFSFKTKSYAFVNLTKYKLNTFKLVT